MLNVKAFNYICFMLTKEHILSYLREKKVEFFSDYQLTKIGLFGSFARHQENQNSDIDIIVEFKPNTENLHDLKTNLKKDLSQKFNRQVDICREKFIKPYYKSDILNSAIYV